MCNRVFLNCCICLSLIAGVASAEIASSESACKPLEVGAKAPDAKLVDERGVEVSLHQLTVGKPTALVFFRGSWCPVCTQALSHVARAQPDLAKMGYQIIAISSESPDELAKWAPYADKDWKRPDAPANETKRQKFERTLLPESALTYKILCDPKAEAAEAFGIAFFKNLVGTEYEKLKKVSLIQQREGRSWLPLPGVFLIDRDGTIRFVDLNRNKDGSLSENYIRRIRSEALVKAAADAMK